MKVFLNPGHMPGVDPGAVNRELGLYESDVARSITERVEFYLNAVGYDTILLQSDNLSGESPGYENITESANNWVADIFVSIHCNAFNGNARGIETLIYSTGGSAETLANNIQNQLVTTLQEIDGSIPDRGIKVRTNLAVLRDTVMPSVLVEVGFIDNIADAKLLTENEEDIAKAIARGISDYYA